MLGLATQIGPALFAMLGLATQILPLAAIDIAAEAARAFDTHRDHALIASAPLTTDGVPLQARLGAVHGSDDHCLAAASGNGVSRVLVTHDGGRSWRQTMDGFSGTLSAMQVMDDGSGEAWAAGGAPEGLELVAHFWHSRDFGETWELHTLPGGIAFDMSFPPGVSDAGFATVLGLVDSGLVQYRRGE